jgi:hypothetical protein
MMQPLQSHPMAPQIDLSAQQHNPLLHSSSQQQQLSNSINDPNEPNPDMLLALISRNKALEGKT